MPHPGDVVRKGEFKGESSKLHPDFLTNLRVLVPSLLDKPETKVDVAGNKLTCSQLSEYFKVTKLIKVLVYKIVYAPNALNGTLLNETRF